MIKIRLLLVEENRILRDGIIAMLKREKDITIASAAGKNRRTILELHRWKPNVILMNLGLRSRQGLRTVELMRKEFPGAKLIVMDLAPVRGDMMQFVKAGASGFILKEASPDDLLITIRAVAEGEKILPPLSASLFSHIVEQAVRGGKAKVKEAVRMTKREREVLDLLGDGLTNREIGSKLRLSAHTVKSHIHNVMEKLALHARLEVADYAFSDRTLALLGSSITLVDGS